MIKPRIIKRKCIDCGSQFTINDIMIDHMKENNLELPKRCKSCREERKKSINIKCNKCGRHFIFSINEQKFYNERGLQYPKHCTDCRRKRNRRGSIERSKED